MRRSFQTAHENLCVALRVWRREPGEEPLHQLRVELRRFRALLRVFANELENCPHDDVEVHLRAAGDRLGSLRDLDVMLALSRKSDDGFRHHVIALMAKERTKQAREIRRAKPWRELEAAAGNFVATLNACPAGKHAAQPFPAFYRKHVQRQVRRILRSAALAKSDDAHDLHVFRIKLRRLRYLGELLAGEGGSRYDGIIVRVHESEQRLGKVHDLDMTLTWVRERCDAGGLAGLADEWMRKRKKRLKQFRKAWVTARRDMATVL